MDFNTLPGTRWILNDSTLSVGPPPASGDTILIIGTALDGPVNTPVTLQNLPNIESLFGPGLFDDTYTSPDADATKKGTYSYNSLVKACGEVIAGGGANILLVRVGGTVATASGTLLGGVTAQAMFPGSLYNGSQLSAVATTQDGVTLTIVTQPTNKGAQGVAFRYPANYTFGQVCQNFNRDRRNKTFQLRCPANIASGTAAANPHAINSITLHNGTSGTTAPGDDNYANKPGIYTAITQDGGALAQASGVNADLVVVADLMADDDIANSPSESFLYDLALFCYEQSRDNYPTLAVIGVRPLSDTSRVGIQNHVDNLVTSNPDVYDDAPTKLVNVAQFIENGIPYNDTSLPGSQTVDLGRYLTIVAGPDLTYASATLGSYTDAGATFYAGMISKLSPQQATTNQPLGGSVGLAYTFTKDQRNLLNAGIDYTGQNDGLGGGAYVTFTLRQPGQGSLVVTEDVTAASRSSSFTNFQIMRIVQAAERVVEAIAQKFVGQANDPGTVATLDSQLRTGLDVLSSQGALFGGKGSGYDYTIGSAATDASLGIIRISLWLRPARQIKRIETTVTVR